MQQSIYRETMNCERIHSESEKWMEEGKFAIC